MHHETEPFEMHQTHDRIPQEIPVHSTCEFVLFCCVPGAPIAIAIHSPARNSKERADTGVPSERAVRSERGNMQAARSEWEDQQRMDE